MSRDANDSPGDSGEAISWQGVTKIYPGGHVALDAVSLGVAQGECLALLGTSGSGKTTLLKMVNRLIDPTSGRVVVLGRPAAEWPAIRLRRSIGYVIQEGGLLPHLDCLANVGLVLSLQGVRRRERDVIARERLDLVGLDPARFGPLRPHQLSGGQRQRVGVARALASDPEVLLMDEPFGALDPITRRNLQDEFVALRKRLNKTVVFVTHDIREALRVADRLAILDGGRLIQEGSGIEMMAEPAGEFVREFFREAEAVGGEARS